MIAVALPAVAGHPFLPLAADGSPDYNMSIPALLARYFPAGLLGIGLTALIASFMSGMAGNVTAFNTVWTYDLYQSYLAPGKSDRHYLWVGRVATVGGVILAIGAAYLAAAFNNIMDLLQLVFGFVNAPLFATFLLGMFWKRATGHGAFWGLLGGTSSAALCHGLSLPAGAAPGIKGGWITAGVRLPQRNGAELLRRHRGLERLFYSDGARFVGYYAEQDRRRAAGAGLFAHPASCRPSGASLGISVRW